MKIVVTKWSLKVIYYSIQKGNDKQREASVMLSVIIIHKLSLFMLADRSAYSKTALLWLLWPLVLTKIIHWRVKIVSVPSYIMTRKCDVNRTLTASERMPLCVFCSPKSSTVVLDSFCWASCDFPLSHFGHPPNMVTCVCPGPKLKAVAVCHTRDCAPSGRVSWRDIQSWIDNDK